MPCHLCHLFILCRCQQFYDMLHIPLVPIATSMKIPQPLKISSILRLHPPNSWLGRGRLQQLGSTYVSRLDTMEIKTHLAGWAMEAAVRVVVGEVEGTIRACHRMHAKACMIRCRASEGECGRLRSRVVACVIRQSWTVADDMRMSVFMSEAYLQRGVKANCLCSMRGICGAICRSCFFIQGPYCLSSIHVQGLGVCYPTSVS